MILGISFYFGAVALYEDITIWLSRQKFVSLRLRREGRLRLGKSIINFVFLSTCTTFAGSILVEWQLGILSSRGLASTT